MLNRETLVANEALAGLSDEQITAIETLSKNDENAVIGARFGEVYRQMDTTIENALGIKRNGDEKTYIFLERAAKEFKDKYGDYDALKGELEELKAKGGDDVAKAQVESLTKELESARKNYASLKASFDSEKEAHEKALSNYKIDNEFAMAIEGIALKAGFSDAVVATLKSQAIANVKRMNPSFELRDGKERLIFHDENGAPMLNAENQLNPFSVKELLVKEFENMEVLDKKPAKGAGGKQTFGGTDILGATTQREAIEVITKMVLELGIPKTSPKFQPKFDEIWESNHVSKLPVK